MNLYRNESSDPKTNAQRNLSMRTHYVDDGTLRFHKSRVLSARHSHGGLLFVIVTSDAADYENTHRVFRYVIFDVFGNVLQRPDLEFGYKTRAKAEAFMSEALRSIDAKAATLEAIARAEKRHAEDIADLRAAVSKLTAEG